MKITKCDLVNGKSAWIWTDQTELHFTLFHWFKRRTWRWNSLEGRLVTSTAQPTNMAVAAKYRNCTDLWLEDKNSTSVAMTWQFVTLAVSRVMVFTRKRQSTGKYNIILNISQRQTVQYSFEVGWLAKSQCLIEVEVQLSQIG